MEDWSTANFNLFKQSYCSDNATCPPYFTRIFIDSTDREYASATLNASTTIKKLNDDGGDVDTYLDASWFTTTALRIYTDDIYNADDWELAISLTRTTQEYKYEKNYTQIPAIMCKQRIIEHRRNQKIISYTWWKLSRVTYVAPCSSSSCIAGESLQEGETDELNKGCRGYYYKVLYESEDYKLSGSGSAGTYSCHERHNTYNDSIDYFDLEVNVRSSEDPYIRAGEITSCSYDFGTSATDYAIIGAFALITGILLLISGPVCCFCAFRMVKQRNQIMSGNNGMSVPLTMPPDTRPMAAGLPIVQPAEHVDTIACPYCRMPLQNPNGVQAVTCPGCFKPIMTPA